MKQLVPLIGLAALFLSPAAHSLRILPLPEGVQSYKDKYYLSELPTPESVKEMSAIGVKLMIDLREDKEKETDLAPSARAAGIAYFSAPVAKVGPLQKEQMEKIEAILQGNETKKAWLFCSTGNRAAAWLAIHLAATKKRSAAEAIAEARKAGLKNEQMIEKLKTYLQDEK